jgi:hypothetical protein
MFPLLSTFTNISASSMKMPIVTTEPLNLFG